MKRKLKSAIFRVLFFLYEIAYHAFTALDVWITYTSIKEEITNPSAHPVLIGSLLTVLVVGTVICFVTGMLITEHACYQLRRNHL